VSEFPLLELVLQL